MFLHLSVILSRGGGMRGRGRAWQGAHVWQGHAWQGHAWQGACVVGRRAWQGGIHATHHYPGHHEIRSVNARAVRILLECILVIYLLCLFLSHHQSQQMKRFSLCDFRSCFPCQRLILAYCKHHLWKKPFHSLHWIIFEN